MTATELMARWDARDRLYRERRTHGELALTETEFNGVLWWRKMEAALLHPGERSIALGKLGQWSSPRGRSL